MLNFSITPPPLKGVRVLQPVGWSALWDDLTALSPSTNSTYMRLEICYPRSVVAGHEVSWQAASRETTVGITRIANNL